MKKIFKLSFLVLAGILMLGLSATASAQLVGGVSVQTNSASNISYSQATLNGNLAIPYISPSNYAWFQWGTDTNYSNTTSQQIVSSTSSGFQQTIFNLNPNTTYHYRAVAQINGGSTIYGQDMTFYTNGSGVIIVALNVQTNSASNISYNQATLNGSIPTNGNYYYNNNLTGYGWFQWGIDTNYGNTTQQQAINAQGANFSQYISNLNPNTTYHYRAVAQINGQTVYGQDMTVLTFNNGNNYVNGNGTLTVTKQATNLTSGNSNWQASVNASPGDILSFVITMQTNGGDVHNVFVRDVLPQYLIYKGNMSVNANLDQSDSVISGLNIGTISAGRAEVISYQAEVAPTTPVSIFSNSATITSAESGTQTASASVIVNNAAAPAPVVAGPTTISTGETNNPITDSFFLPLFLIVLMSWLYFTGKIYKFADWINEKL